MADKTLVCSECGNEFVFTEGEQAFYAEKGFTNEPKRCPECRKARKQQRFNKNQEKSSTIVAESKPYQLSFDHII